MRTGADDPWRDVMSMYAQYLELRTKHPDLAAFHTRRFEAYRECLGVDVSRRPDGDRHHLHHLMDGFARQYSALRSPFGVYLEATAGLVAVYQRHGAPIGQHFAALQECYLDVMVDCANQLWGPCPRVVTAPMLAERGVGPADEPDELDYW